MPLSSISAAHEELPFELRALEICLDTVSQVRRAALVNDTQGRCRRAAADAGFKRRLPVHVLACRVACGLRRACVAGSPYSAGVPRMLGQSPAPRHGPVLYLTTARTLSSVHPGTLRWYRLQYLERLTGDLEAAAHPALDALTGKVRTQPPTVHFPAAHFSALRRGASAGALQAHACSCVLWGCALFCGCCRQRQLPTGLACVPPCHAASKEAAA